MLDIQTATLLNYILVYMSRNIVEGSILLQCDVISRLVHWDIIAITFFNEKLHTSGAHSDHKG